MNLWIALSQSVFEWIWQNSIYATLLFVLVVALQKILARWLTPRLRYTLSLLVLIRLLLPIVPSSVLSFENAVPQMAALASRAASLPVSGPPAEVAITIQPHDLSSPPGPAWLPFRISLSAVSCIVWASGLLCLFFLARWRLGQWHRLIKNGRRISDPKLLALLNSSRQAMGVRRPVELVAIAQLSSPAVFGLWKIRLLLPETASSQLTDDELRLIFLHEMAHLRRNDVPLNFLLMTVQFLHWFNPLVWLAFHRLRADQELVCDAMVMQKLGPGERLGYGKVLLKLMDGFPAAIPGFSGAVPVISSLTEIRRRLLMIKNHRQATIAACVTTTLLVLVLAFGSFTHAHRQEQPTAAKNPVSGERVASHSAETNHLAELTKTTIANLKEQLKSADYMVRVNALVNFRDLPTTETEAENPSLAEAVPILLQATKDDNRMVRNFAVSALWHIRSPEEGVVKALGSIVAHETDANVACIAATALKDLGPAAALAVPDLMEDLVKRNDDDGTFISHSDGLVAQGVSKGSLLRAVIEALGNIGAPAQNAVPLLRGRLDDTGPESLVNRVFSAKALWQITGETNEAVPVLINALQKDNSFWAADILGVMGTAAKPAVPALQAKLQTGDGYIRLYSAIALNKIEPDFQLRPILLDSLQDAGTGTRLVAAQNIWSNYHDSQTILPTLIEFLKPKDQGPNLSDVARSMHLEIDPRAAKKAGVAE